MGHFALARRVLAALVGIAFLLAMTDPMFSHGCLIHDAVAQTTASMPGMPGMPDMPGGTQDHGHTPDHGHQCCVASCCASLLTIATGRLVALPVVPIAIVATTVAPKTPRPPKPDGVVLPPPLGPPPGLLV
jgi:hypothetical protein